MINCGTNSDDYHTVSNSLVVNKVNLSFKRNLKVLLLNYNMHCWCDLQVTSGGVCLQSIQQQTAESALLPSLLLIYC